MYTELAAIFVKAVLIKRYWACTDTPPVDNAFEPKEGVRRGKLILFKRQTN